MPPIIEPAQLLRPPMRANAGTSSGSDGAPTLTRVPSRLSSERYFAIGRVAETVLMIRSKAPASSENVASSLVA